MTRHLFILVAVLAVVVGRKGNVAGCSRRY